MRCAVDARWRSVALVLVASVGLALAARAVVRAAPQTAPSSDPMNALLSEVHALRIAMEQSASIAPRVQLTLARLNIEEQRISQLAAQLDQVRRELTAVGLESQKLSDQLPEVEQVLRTTTDDAERKSHEYERIAIKRKLSAQARLEQQLRTRETESAQSLGTEQSRWVDLNTRLDELERLLGPVPR